MLAGWVQRDRWPTTALMASGGSVPGGIFCHTGPHRQIPPIHYRDPGTGRNGYSDVGDIHVVQSHIVVVRHCPSPNISICHVPAGCPCVWGRLPGSRLLANPGRLIGGRAFFSCSPPTGLPRTLAVSTRGLNPAETWGSPVNHCMEHMCVPWPDEFISQPDLMFPL